MITRAYDIFIGSMVSLTLIPMSLYWTTSVSATRAKLINDMQARESMARQTVRESIAHSTKIKRIDRLTTIG